LLFQEKKELNISATKLQARFRGKQARIKVQDVSEEKYDAWRKKDALQSLFRLKDRDMDGFLGIQELGTMIRKNIKKNKKNMKGRSSSHNSSGRRSSKDQTKDIVKLVKAMNLTNPNEKDLHKGDGSSNSGVSEETFVQYMLQGLQMTRKTMVQFRRKGYIQSMLADLIESMSNSVSSRILSERSAALNAVFNHFDEDNSGEIDQNEFLGLITYFSGKGAGNFSAIPTSNEIKDLMNSLDQGGDGKLQREEFIAFAMGGLAKTAKERRKYATQSSMHNKLCVLLDRISLGIDRRTKSLHTHFELLVEKNWRENKTRTLDVKCLYHAIFKSNVMGNAPSKEVIKKMKIASKRFIQAISGSGNGSIEKNDFVLFLLSGGSDPAVLKAQHPIVDKWRTNLLKTMPW
tara:strand:+ start:935 stop:2143 length:1209 start_codon:yes stop_codon:yes gene_type:complete